MVKTYFYYRIGGRLRTCPCEIVERDGERVLVRGINRLAHLGEGETKWVMSEHITDTRIDPNPYGNSTANEVSGKDFN